MVSVDLSKGKLRDVPRPRPLRAEVVPAEGPGVERCRISREEEPEDPLGPLLVELGSDAHHVEEPAREERPDDVVPSHDVGAEAGGEDLPLLVDDAQRLVDAWVDPHEATEFLSPSSPS